MSSRLSQLGMAGLPVNHTEPGTRHKVAFSLACAIGERLKKFYCHGMPTPLSGNASLASASANSMSPSHKFSQSYVCYLD
jgi:hypothetical protein